VRSIVVKPEAKGQGAGGRILSALIEEAEEHGIQSVCLFTRIPDFFFKYGFRTVEDKTELPDKVFKDCQNCPACIVATKLRWCAVEFRACPSSDHGKRRRSWCGSRGRSQWSVISYRCPAFEVSQLQQMPGRSSGHRRRAYEAMLQHCEAFFFKTERKRRVSRRLCIQPPLIAT